MYSDDAISPESLNRYIGQANSPQAMKAVAKALEAVFANELVKEMWATTGADNKDFANQTYTSMFNMQLANLWAEQGMGLENAIISQLERDKLKAASKDSQHNPSKANEEIKPEPTVSPSVSNALAGPSVLSPVSRAVAGGVKPPAKASGGGRAEIKSMIRAAFGGQAANAMAVLYAESGGDPGAVHYNTFYGSTDYGLFQINDRYWADRLEKQGIIRSVADLLDPGKNVEAAAWIYRHGGWGQWTSVRQGRVRLSGGLYADNAF